jgi:hypothetical protein
MFINICPRLIQKQILQGINFVETDYGVHVANTELLPFGVFSSKIYEEGDVVRTMSGKLTNYPTKSSIHIGNNMHLKDEYGKYINHSFEPNVRVELNKLIAIKRINIYDEITFNYNETETKMNSPFEHDGFEVCGNLNI